jgi:hypothetical protein
VGGSAVVSRAAVHKENKKERKKGNGINTPSK